MSCAARRLEDYARITFRGFSHIITVLLGLSAPQVRERQFAVVFEKGDEHLLLK
jgi:hypothetical protein